MYLCKYSDSYRYLLPFCLSVQTEPKNLRLNYHQFGLQEKLYLSPKTRRIPNASLIMHCIKWYLKVEDFLVDVNQNVPVSEQDNYFYRNPAAVDVFETAAPAT